MIRMKLVVYGSKRLGCLLENGSMVDLNLAYAASLMSRNVSRPYAHANTILPSCLLDFIEEGELALGAAKEAVSYAEKSSEGPRGEKLVFKPGEFKLRAPLPSLASRIAMAGANFYDHSADVSSMMSDKKVTIDDVKRDVAEGIHKPWGFWKLARNVIDPEEPITYPSRSDRLDYEVEVAAIFGRKGKDIPEKEAMNYIFGYTILNDLSLRDQSGDDRGLFFGKNFDTCAPMGPCIVTSDELGDPHVLGLKLEVNGVIRQDGTMRNMIRPFPWWISWLTSDMTFYPGDIISGGTCSGTALDSSPRDAAGKTKPDRFLKPGDVVEASVEKIGTLRNQVKSKQ